MPLESGLLQTVSHYKKPKYSLECSWKDLHLDLKDSSILFKV